MKFLAPLLLFSIACTCHVFSQRPQTITAESVYKIYNDSTIYLTSNRNYIKSDVKFLKGFAMTGLIRELRKSPDAFEAYKVYRRKMWTGNVLAITSTAGAVVAIGFMAWPVAVGCLVPYTVGLIQVGTASTHLNKAVWILNRDQIIKGIQK